MTGVFSRRRTVLAGMLAALAVAACESSTSTQKTIEPGRIIVTASVAGTPISTVVVEVSASDIAMPLIFNLQIGIAFGQSGERAARTPCLSSLRFSNRRGLSAPLHAFPKA